VLLKKLALYGDKRVRFDHTTSALISSGSKLAMSVNRAFKESPETHPQQSAIGEHAFFQARIEKINMILHEFIYGPNRRSPAFAAVFGIESSHQRLPIWLDDFCGTKV